MDTGRRAEQETNIVEIASRLLLRRHKIGSSRPGVKVAAHNQRVDRAVPAPVVAWAGADARKSGAFVEGDGRGVVRGDLQEHGLGPGRGGRAHRRLDQDAGQPPAAGGGIGGEGEDLRLTGDGPGEDEGAPTFDAAAESAFLAEARERGEAVASPRRADAPEPEEADPKALPPLDTLVKRISPEVRELLDELFRVKFVRVTRVPRKALKS